jgi:phage shock protein C
MRRSWRMPSLMAKRWVNEESMTEKKRLYRSLDNRKIAGVCGGLGEYFDIDPTMVRLAWVIFTLVGGAGLLGYIIAWIVMPEQKRA